jgi:hypothetical protein
MNTFRGYLIGNLRLQIEFASILDSVKRPGNIDVRGYAGPVLLVWDFMMITPRLGVGMLLLLISQSSNKVNKR